MNIRTLDANLRHRTKIEELILQGIVVDYTAFPVEGYYNGKPYISFTSQENNALLKDTITVLDYYRNLVTTKQDRFQAVPFHIHEWIELNYMYSGSCTITINDTSVKLEKGQATLINTNAPHSISECREEDILINFLIRRDYLDGNFFSRLSKDSYLTDFFIGALNTKKEQDNFIIFHSEKSSHLPVYISQFLCEYYDNSISSDNILDCLMTLILCELINVFENDLSHEKKDSAETAVGPIIRYIEHNYNTCTLKSTARFFNMHPNYLSVYLKKYTGLTYKKLIQKQRIRQAANLLKNSSLSVEDISFHVGYSNINFFYQKFREEYECTPGEYRTLLETPVDAAAGQTRSHA